MISVAKKSISSVHILKQNAMIAMYYIDLRKDDSSITCLDTDFTFAVTPTTNSILHATFLLKKCLHFIWHFFQGFIDTMYVHTRNHMLQLLHATLHTVTTIGKIFFKNSRF